MRLRRALPVAAGAIVFLIGVVGSVAGAALWQIQSLVGRTDVPREAIADPASLAFTLVLVVTGVSVLLLVGAGWYASQSVMLRLDALLRATRQMRDGNLDIEMSVTGRDELSDLGRNIQDMAESLQRRTVSRSYLDDVLDSMAEMLFVVDESNRIEHANLAAMERLGFTKPDLQGRFLDDLLLGDAPLPSPDDTVFRRTGSVTQIEREMQTQDGDTLPVLVSRSLLRGSPADAPDIVCVAQDISARKRAEEQLRASLDEKEVLLREIHHRVKNNLQVIASLLHVQSKKVEDENARRLFSESQDRIRSMAFIHERLYQSEDLSQVNFSAYLDRLTEHLYRSHGVALRDVTCKLDSEDAILSVDRAIPAGLIVNELVSNALEHAFPDERNGVITVGFSTSDDHGCLRISDNGVGVDDTEAMERDQTLGLRLVKGLVRQLRGDMDIDGAGGLTYTINFPLTDEELETA